MSSALWSIIWTSHEVLTGCVSQITQTSTVFNPHQVRMSSNAKLAELKRHFGSRVDADVLLSVLAVCGDDVGQAISFLTAGQGDMVVDLNADPNEEHIPDDYPAQKPTGKIPVPARTKDVKVKREIDTIVKRHRRMFVGEYVGEYTIVDHKKEFDSHRAEYISTLLLLLFQRVEVARNARSRILAISWHSKFYELSNLFHATAFSWSSDFLLKEFPELFGLPEVLRAVEFMDAPRRVIYLEKKKAVIMKQLAANHDRKRSGKDDQNVDLDGRLRSKKLGEVRSQIQALTKETLEGASMPGSLVKRVKRWVRTIDAPTLAFYALQMPKEPWKQLADTLHLSSRDFAASWFLGVAFGKQPPADSILAVCERLTPKNVVSVLSAGHKIPYSYLRVKVRPLPNEAKKLIAAYATTTELLWFHEELNTPEVNRIIQSRLIEGDFPKFSYGKLMERLLYFQRIHAAFYRTLIPVAQKELDSIELLVEPPVAVLGDGSYSMDVAIRTSTIIASVLTVLTGSDLKFFNVVAVDPPIHPKNVEDVIQVASEFQADGLTAPAAALMPYYTKKKKVKFFVVVTDEIENEKFENWHYFPDLFLKYYQEVYPATLLMVSFIDGANKKGRMVQSLENMGLDVLQFRLDGSRPDLTKLDTLLGILSSESSLFASHINDLASIYKKSGLADLIQRLKNPPRKEIVENDPVEEKEDNEEKEEKKNDSLFDDLPDHFCCPITADLMTDPVITPLGHTYERAVLEAHLANSSTDPLTNSPLSLDDIRPNRALKEAIESYKKEHNIL